MKIGSITLTNNLILAPMAGVTDKPFRQLCRELGAGLAVSEMITSNIALWNSRKSRHRLDHRGEDSPRAVQIAGADPDMMAMAARLNVDNGAEIIDINMGCPAKKVCNVMAGSALLQNEQLVTQILESVVNAVTVPVTLKIRTGNDKQHRNALTIARIAEQSGIRMLSVHGRTRACAFTGEAEYETVTAIKAAVNIPVVANGDISSPQQAARVLKQTGVDGIMIGRAAQGNPWIFSQINHFLTTGELQSAPADTEICATLIRHLVNLYNFYDEYTGVRIARKHIGWYCKQQQGASVFRARVNRIESAREQLAAVRNYFATRESITVQAQQAA
jgi:tRNA-dihydrouridine synthase B